MPFLGAGGNTTNTGTSTIKADYKLMSIDSHEYRIAVLSSRNKLVGCPLGVPISYYINMVHQASKYDGLS